MNQTTIVDQLKSYIAQDILGGNDIGLDEKTPLLEWGIINSMGIVKLLRFMHQQFSVDIPSNKIVADSFTDIVSIANLVLEQMPARS